MKLISYSVYLLFTLFLCGCRPQITITEQQVNDALVKRGLYQKEVGLPGLLQAKITVTQLAALIGRDAANNVVLTGNAHIEFNSLFKNDEARVALTLRALPHFDKQAGAIYLYDLELVSAKVDPQRVQPTIDLLLPYFSQSLADYFKHKPAYVLSEDKSLAERLAKTFVQDLRVTEGKLVIPLTK